MMKNNTVIAFLLLALIEASGCVSPPLKPEDPSLNDLNSGTVYVYRIPSLIGGSGEYRFFLNGELIGTLGSGGTFIRRIPIGQKTVILKRYDMGIPSLGEWSITFLVVAGKEYFLRTDSNLSAAILIGNVVGVTQSTEITLVSREQWQAD